jgi:hypothetical protein
MQIIMYVCRNTFWSVNQLVKLAGRPTLFTCVGKGRTGRQTMKHGIIISSSDSLLAFHFNISMAKIFFDHFEKLFIVV